jgi:hypothetical protein
MHGRVVYTDADLDRYIAQHRCRSTAESRKKAA